MARRKTTKPKVIEEEVQLPKVIKEKVRKATKLITTINCVINSSYVIDYPNIINFTTTILLNDKPIEDTISNRAGKYKGVKLVKKNDKFIIYTGKHGLISTEDATSGVLTIQFMEI